MNEIKRAAIYSPEEDSYGIGLAMTFIMDRGLTFSGLYMGKESLHRFADDAARGFFDACIVKNMDVLSEETDDLLTIEDMIPVLFIGAEDLYYTKENLNIETMQYEKPRKTRSKTKSAEGGSNAAVAVDRRRDENWTGVIPFGFMKTNGKIVTDPTSSLWVEVIYDKALEGERLTDIAAYLDRKGVPVPGASTRWSDNTIRDILRNERYTKGIISRDVFNKVQVRFTDHLKGTEVKSKPEAKARGLYQGITYCGSCKRTMAYQGVGTNRRKTAVYFCKYHTGTNPRSEALDHMPMVEEEKLKEEVLRQCNEYIRHMSDNKNLEAAINRLEKKKNSYEKQINAVGEKVIRNKIIKNTDGLWTSWEAARRRYLSAVAYVALLKHRFQVYHIGYMDENDLDTERKLMDSITVKPDGTVKVNFKGDWIFN